MPPRLMTVTRLRAARRLGEQDRVSEKPAPLAEDGNDKKRHANAERQRKFRARKRDGIVLVTLPVTFDDLDALEKMKLLAETDERNKQAIAAAFFKLLDMRDEEIR